MTETLKTAKEVLSLMSDQGIKIVDFRFTDLLGAWRHTSIPARELTAKVFERGIGFDGSSIRGFQTIDESDMILMPDPTTAFVDPTLEVPSLAIICQVYDPVEWQPYARDPRYIANKAEAYLKQSGIADVSYWGPEAEFFLFKDVRYGGNSNSSFYFIDSQEGWWNSGKELSSNFGGQIPQKRGYFAVPPTDTQQDVRSKIVLALEGVGVEVEVHHHEVATAGQGEIVMRFAALSRMADNMMIYKYLVKNVARQNGLTATFMPKPLFEDNASGMHTHQSLWKGDQNLFFDKEGYAEISETARFYIGGLLKHAPALLALAAPTTNSYRRLVPGFEAPINLAYSKRNRSACVRIPVYSKDPSAKRIEFRPPDASSNPYLCFAAVLMAGLDGVQKRIDPGNPMDMDLYHLAPEEAAHIESTPGSLAEVLDALEADHDFLLEGDVFTAEVIETWIAYKRENEVDPVRMRPHPYEFSLYYDV